METYEYIPKPELHGRLAVRLASLVIDRLRLDAAFEDHQLNLLFDALANGLEGRTEDELLALVSIY
jgi:hypothetical protein